MQLYAGVADDIIYDRKGFYLFLSNSTDFPASYTNAKFTLTPGVGLSLVPARTFYNQYQAPYSGCAVKENKKLTEPLDDQSYFKFSYTANFTYKQVNCISLCKLMFILDLCKCNLSTFNSLKLSAEYYCDSYDKINCTIVEGWKMDKGTMEQICLPKCPLECNQNTLSPITVSSYRFPNDKYASDVEAIEAINKTIPFIKDLSENLVEFSVYYESLSYTKIEEVPKMTVDDLIAIIGGHLHVFLGMSILSFVELLEIAALAMSVILRKRKIDKKVHEDDAAIELESVKSETNIMGQTSNKTVWSTNPPQRPLANITDWS